MPVRRYRDVAEMESPVLERGDPRLFKAMRECWLVAERTLRPRYPAGVWKRRSWEEMVAREEEWEREIFARYRARVEAGKRRDTAG